MLGEKLMATVDMKKQAQSIMEEWDPFSLGNIHYQTEIALVCAQLDALDDPSKLAKQIQHIYQDASGMWIPFEKCVTVSYKLLALKFQAKQII
jgi:hypothetical protein